RFPKVLFPKNHFQAKVFSTSDTGRGFALPPNHRGKIPSEPQKCDGSKAALLRAPKMAVALFLFLKLHFEWYCNFPQNRFRQSRLLPDRENPLHIQKRSAPVFLQHSPKYPTRYPAPNIKWATVSKPPFERLPPLLLR